jgi:hypothetical protein
VIIYYRAQHYMKRRHPRKSGWWRTTKDWGHTLGPRQDRWVCLDKVRHATLRKFARTIGDSDKPEPIPRRLHIASFFNGKRGSARAVISTWKMARKPTYTM